jgi:hypothetical protein
MGSLLAGDDGKISPHPRHVADRDLFPGCHYRCHDHHVFRNSTGAGAAHLFSESILTSIMSTGIFMQVSKAEECQNGICSYAFICRIGIVC